MTSALPFRLVTARDIEILRCLDHCPLTTTQLYRFSQTFDTPFTTERRVRERLQILEESGRVHRWQYATAGRGAPNYYVLTRRGFRLLYGESAQPSTKRAFQPVAIARQHHTQSLADFIVHTAGAAYRHAVAFTEFARENTLKLSVGDECLYPDCGFTLVASDGTHFRYFVEIDAGSERIYSPRDLDSWERKIRLYESYQDACPQRFRVLIVATRSRERPRHILAAAAKLVRNPQRSLFYGVSLGAYLGREDVLSAPCFHDHRGSTVALLPQRSRLQPAWSPRPVRDLPPCGLPSLAT